MADAQRAKKQRKMKCMKHNFVMSAKSVRICLPACYG